MSYLLFFLGLAVFLIAAGLLYQWLGSHRDRLRDTREGRWIRLADGLKLYLAEKGEGEATVLFESGIAATHLNWFNIQEKVSKFAFTASYDRGGLGWSDSTQTARTPANLATELHELLQIAGIKPPYILVGHSFGGLVMRQFALLYPDEVTSVILVDPMRCDEWPPLDPSKQATIDRGSQLSTYAIPIAYLGLARLAVTSLLCRSGRTAERLAGAAGDGGLHVLSRIKDEVGKMPQQLWPAVAAHWSRPAYYAGMRSHIESVPDSVREMLQTDPIIRSIPVLLLTPGRSTPLSKEDMQLIGDNVQQVIAHASAHWIHLDEPEVVIDAILESVMTSSHEVAAV